MRHLFLFEGLWAMVHLIGLIKGILICKCYQSVRWGVRSCTITKLSNMATFHFYWLKWEMREVFFLFEQLEGIAPSLSSRSWMEVKGGDPNVKKNEQMWGHYQYPFHHLHTLVTRYKRVFVLPISWLKDGMVLGKLGGFLNLNDTETKDEGWKFGPKCQNFWCHKIRELFRLWKGRQIS